MKKILVAIDFSDTTNHVIVKAVELKKAFDAEMFILHTEPPEIFIPSEEMPYEYMAEIIKRNAENDRRYLLDIRDKLANEDIEVHCMLVDGPPVEVILREALEYDADLIVLGSHEHGRFYHALFGSVREGIIHRAKCPVLVVPHGD